MYAWFCSRLWCPRSVTSIKFVRKIKIVGIYRKKLLNLNRPIRLLVEYGFNDMSGEYSKTLPIENSYLWVRLAQFFSVQ